MWMRRKAVDGREGVKLRGELEGGWDQVCQDYVGDAGVVGYGGVGGVRQVRRVFLW